MSWLAEQADAGTPFERTLGLRPDLLELYREFYAQPWTAGLVDPIVLELCRLRIAAIHGATAEATVRYDIARDAGLTEEKVAALSHYYDSPLFSDLERRCLNYAEQFVIDVHSISDDDAATVTSVLTPQQFVAFTMALAMFDGFGRFKLVLGVDGPAEPTVVASPQPSSGALV
jgi:alkylhydroperoxidase family enzyme